MSSEPSKELEEVLSRPTYYEEETYFNPMTMIDGLICTVHTAIVVSADGRDINKHGIVTSDHADKIYELSPRCVAMFAGSVPGNIDDRMDAQHLQFIKRRVSDVTKIASEVFGSIKRSDEIAKGKLALLVSIIAGYNFGSDGEYTPHLYVIFKDKDGNWQRNEPSPHYLHGGEAYYEVKAILEAEYDEQADLDAIKKLAVKTIRVASNAKPDNTGGQPSLWIMRPQVPIERLSPEQIAAIAATIDR